MKKNKVLRILAAVVAFSLIAVVLFFINAFCGNPVSYLLARYSAGQYIEENFPESDYEIDNVSYFFKNSDYTVTVKSQSSTDSHFRITLGFFGEIHRVTYEDAVLNKGNTQERINREYFETVSSVLEHEVFPYETDYGFGEICFSYEANNDSANSGVIYVRELELDKNYDMAEIGKKAGKVVLHVRDEVTVKNAAEILRKTKQLLNSVDVYFYTIDLMLMERRTDDGKFSESFIYLPDFESAYIDEDTLEEKIEAVIKENEEADNETYESKRQNTDDYNETTDN